MEELEMMPFECEQVEEAESIPEVEVSEGDELSVLRKEVEELRAMLREREALDAANARMREELEEFYEYFPSVDPKSVPDDVWEKVKGGASLAATYSLFERKRARDEQKALEHNQKMRKMSAGSIESRGAESYFSPDEVKKMTPAQVKRHYDDIVESMRHWN